MMLRQSEALLTGALVFCCLVAVCATTRPGFTEDRRLVVAQSTPTDEETITVAPTVSEDAPAERSVGEPPSASQPQPVYPDEEPDAATESDTASEPSDSQPQPVYPDDEAVEANETDAPTQDEAVYDREKDAYDASKELGTVEAWQAFLTRFPEGFHADLARAYLKKLADEAPKASEVPEAETPSPAPEATEAETETATTEKEAYDAAKDLGTLEAWEAFLTRYPEGFLADLARGYLKKLADEAPETPEEAVIGTPPAPEAAETAPSSSAEKDAYQAAKELGTVGAWEAFLTNFPKGFHADLARAYLQKLGSGAPAGTEKLPPEPVVTPVAPPASPADISLTTTANQTSCAGGDSCSYTVVATNNGGTAFSGDLVIANALSPFGAALSSTANAPWVCEGMGGGAVCTSASAYLAPGESTNLSLTFQLPRNAGRSVTSCASISWGGVPTASGVIDVQQALNDLGHDVGRPDGKAGRNTANGIRAFQQENGLQETGEVDLPLLIAMFTVPQYGDADPVNDQACTGTAVIAQPATVAAEPDVEYCGGGRVRDRDGACVCPATFPHWTGKTCIPRRERNCIGGTYYDKGQKLCLCPSRRPFWYNDRCHATLNECAEDGVVVGNRCVQQFPPGRDGHGIGRRTICPPNLTLVGNSCVNLSNAPVFGFGRGGFQGGGKGGGAPKAATQQTGPGAPQQQQQQQQPQQNKQLQQLKLTPQQKKQLQQLTQPQQQKPQPPQNATTPPPPPIVKQLQPPAQQPQQQQQQGKVTAPAAVCPIGALKDCTCPPDTIVTFDSFNGTNPRCFPRAQLPDFTLQQQQQRTQPRRRHHRS